MIQIPRSLARQLRAVFRRIVSKSLPVRPVISFQAGDFGRAIRLYHTEIAAQFCEPGQWPVENLAIPVDALADFEGRSESIVTLERYGSSIRARWDDAGVPREMEYESQDVANMPAFPAAAEKLSSNEPGFLKALADANQCAARDFIRYAINHLQLRGKTGEVIATDGRQLLVLSGFQFPWDEDLLVPASPVFSCREIPQDVPVEVGRTATHVIFKIGPWNLFLPINTEGRFPRTEEVIPSEAAAQTRWHIDPEDALFLDKALKRLPGGSEDNAPVTVDLNGVAIIRAKASDQPRATEVVAAKSPVEGKPALICLNRNLLARALQLGFPEVLVLKPETPILCQDSRRKYVVMPLGKSSAIPAGGDVLRVETRQDRTSETPSPTPQRRIPAVANPETNTNAAPQANGNSIGTLIAEAEALRSQLHDAYVRSGKLLVAIRRKRKQAQVVQSTLAALKGLQHVDG
jgi:hypothetical protein